MTTCCLCTAPATYRTTAMCCDQTRERGTPMCARHACSGCEVAPADAPPLIASGARCTECDMESEPCTRCHLRHAHARIAELEADVQRLTTGSAYARLEDAHKALAERAASYMGERDEAIKRERERAKLAAEAPRFVRALLAAEWGHEANCPVCGRDRNGRLAQPGTHVPKCPLDDALTAAGLPDQASRDAARTIA